MIINNDALRDIDTRIGEIRNRLFLLPSGKWWYQVPSSSHANNIEIEYTRLLRQSSTDPGYGLVGINCDSIELAEFVSNAPRDIEFLLSEIERLKLSSNG